MGGVIGAGSSGDCVSTPPCVPPSPDSPSLLSEELLFEEYTSLVSTDSLASVDTAFCILPAWGGAPLPAPPMGGVVFLSLSFDKDLLTMVTGRLFAFLEIQQARFS